MRDNFDAYRSEKDHDCIPRRRTSHLHGVAARGELNLLIILDVPEPVRILLVALSGGGRRGMGVAAMAMAKPGLASLIGVTALTLAVGLACSGAARAALIDRGGGLIYDTVQDIT